MHYGARDVLFHSALRDPVERRDILLLHVLQPKKDENIACQLAELTQRLQHLRERSLSIENALRRTLEVAERCTVELSLGELHLPVFDVPEGRDAFDYLVEQCEKGLHKRYDKVTPELQERLRYELKTIREMGFTDSFLIVFSS